MTKFFLFTLVFVCGLLLSAYGQQNKEKADSPLLASDRPEVYLSFVKLKKFGDISEKNEAERLFFTVTNNTRWGISLYMSGVGDKRFGDASLYYKVLDADTKGYLQGSQTCLVCSRNILKPNESLTFSIGIGNIVSTSVFISIEYKFEWAEDVLSYNGSNSFHSARISLSELPPDALSRLKTAIEELEKRRYKL